MSKFIELISVALQDMFHNVLLKIINYLPNLFGAFVILIIGVLVAFLVRKLVVRLVKFVSYEMSFDWRFWAGRVSFWAMFLIFAVPALQTLQLTNISDGLQQLFSFFPRLFAGGLVFGVGMIAVNFASDLVAESARKAHLEYATAVGKVVYYTLSLILGILALAQAGVQTNILSGIFLVILVSIGLALSLAFGLGSRSVVENALAGAFIRDHFPSGRKVLIEGVEGTVQEVGIVTTVIVSVSGDKITVPNLMLVQNLVK